MAGARTPVTKLQAARINQGFTQTSLIHAMTQRAAVLNIPIASRSSLHTMLSRWENGHDDVTDPAYRRLLREILGRTNQELGFPDEPHDETTDELRERLTIARSIDAHTIELFSRQVNTIRHLDRRFGAATLLDQLNNHIDEIEHLLTFSTATRHRAQLAAVLADGATLAGWEALDRGALAQAWRRHETAKAAAREAGSPALLAYATAQQAFILLDLNDPGAAVEQLDHARTLGTRHAVPALLRAWLAAAHGEGLAATGARDAALTAFDHANTLLPAEHDRPELPFLMLNDTHLSRWRGAVLTQLSEPEAVDELERALRALTTNTARARTGMLTDLAFAYSATGDREATLSYAAQARRLATQIGSDRHRRRLTTLTLPTGTQLPGTA